jgi:hypothetical protein
VRLIIVSNQINTSDLFIALSDQQQELVTGGADFELASSNYANKGSLLMGTSVSGPQGSTASSAGKSNTILTAGQDFLGLGGEIPADIGALGPATLPGEGGTVTPTLPLTQIATPITTGIASGGVLA